jgi:hypothetical protein
MGNPARFELVTIERSTWHTSPQQWHPAIQSITEKYRWLT